MISRLFTGFKKILKPWILTTQAKILGFYFLQQSRVITHSGYLGKHRVFIFFYLEVQGKSGLL